MTNDPNNPAEFPEAMDRILRDYPDEFRNVNTWHEIEDDDLLSYLAHWIADKARAEEAVTQSYGEDGLQELWDKTAEKLLNADDLRMDIAGGITAFTDPDWTMDVLLISSSAAHRYAARVSYADGSWMWFYVNWDVIVDVRPTGDVGHD